MKRYYHRVNYTKLLNELQNQSKEKPPVKNKAIHEADVESAAVRAKRMRKKALQDPKIRFIYSLQSGQIHDKDCHYVSGIDLESLWPMESFPEKMRRCSSCYRRALVRAGLPADKTKDINAYYDTLYRIGFTEEELYSMTIQYGIQFCGLGQNKVRVKLRDDAWEICRNGDSLLLMHNSYIIVDGYERHFTGDFHLQKVSDQAHAIASFLKIMNSYSWQEHIELLKAQDALRAAHRERQKRIEYLAGVNNFVRIQMLPSRQRL